MHVGELLHPQLQLAYSYSSSVNFLFQFASLTFQLSIIFPRKSRMGRNTSTPESLDNEGCLAGSGNDLGFHSIRDRFPLKRNPSHYRNRAKADSDHSPLHRGRSHHSRFNRKGLLWLKGKSAFYSVVILAVFLFAMASMMLQSSITSVFRQGGERGRSLREGLRFGSTLKFVPAMVSRRDGLDPLRSKPRIGLRAPRLALVSSVWMLFSFIFGVEIVCILWGEFC